MGLRDVLVRLLRPDGVPPMPCDCEDPERALPSSARDGAPLVPILGGGSRPGPRRTPGG